MTMGIPPPKEIPLSAINNNEVETLVIVDESLGMKVSGGREPPVAVGGVTSRNFKLEIIKNLMRF